MGPDGRTRTGAGRRYLEKEVVPIFYDRNTEGIPRAWLSRVRLGNLPPNDVTVQAVHGVLDTNRQVVHGTPTPLTWKRETDGLHHYEGDIPCEQSGQQGFSVRVLPTNPDAELPIELSLITWE
jgi:hypothetical protein